MSGHSDAVERGFSSCVHCGLCLEHCPTYVTLGLEMDSPRGRIVIMKGVIEGRIDATESADRHVDLCLGCRACETACPSGVPYGELLESFRASRRPARRRRWTDRMLDYLIFHVFPDARRLRRCIGLGRLVRDFGIEQAMHEIGWQRLLPAWLLKLTEMLPDEEDRDTEPLRPEHVATLSRGGDAASLFTGCIGEAVFAHVNRATIRVLNRCGVSVHCPAAQVCCGAIHAHGGRIDDARRLARHNIDVFDANGATPIVCSVAGCGAMLKQYGQLLAGDPHYAERARRFASRVRDVSEFIATRPLTLRLRSINATVTYHDPCHLCHAQGIRAEPRALLRAIPGLNLIELPESEMCCGAAGTYNLTELAMAERLAERKVDYIRGTGATVVATGNAGCQLQIAAALRRRGLAVQVVHPVELLDRASAPPGG